MSASLVDIASDDFRERLLKALPLHAVQEVAIEEMLRTFIYPDPRPRLVPPDVGVPEAVRSWELFSKLHVVVPTPGLCFLFPLIWFGRQGTALYRLLREHPIDTQKLTLRRHGLWLKKRRRRFCGTLALLCYEVLDADDVDETCDGIEDDPDPDVDVWREDYVLTFPVQVQDEIECRELTFETQEDAVRVAVDLIQECSGLLDSDEVIDDSTVHLLDDCTVDTRSVLLPISEGVDLRIDSSEWIIEDLSVEGGPPRRRPVYYSSLVLVTKPGSIGFNLSEAQLTIESARGSSSPSMDLEPSSQLCRTRWVHYFSEHPAYRTLFEGCPIPVIEEVVFERSECAPAAFSMVELLRHIIFFRKAESLRASAVEPESVLEAEVRESMQTWHRLAEMYPSDAVEKF